MYTCTHIKNIRSYKVKNANLESRVTYLHNSCSKPTPCSPIHETCFDFVRLWHDDIAQVTVKFRIPGQFNNLSCSGLYIWQPNVCDNMLSDICSNTGVKTHRFSSNTSSFVPIIETILPYALAAPISYCTLTVINI